MKAARLHLLIDLAGSVIVVVAGAALIGSSARWIDPVASLAVLAALSGRDDEAHRMIEEASALLADIAAGPDLLAGQALHQAVLTADGDPDVLEAAVDAVEDVAAKSAYIRLVRRWVLDIAARWRTASLRAAGPALPSP